VNSANLRASRAAKPPNPADLAACDLKKHVAVIDDPLLRRWERIVQEIRA